MSKLEWEKRASSDRANKEPIAYKKIEIPEKSAQFQQLKTLKSRVELCEWKSTKQKTFIIKKLVKAHSSAKGKLGGYRGSKTCLAISQLITKHDCK